MKLNNKTTLLIFTLTFISNVAFAQAKEIKIEFLGNCGLYMTDGQTNIYTDFPYKSGAFGYMEFEASELDSIKENSIFIFTHKHADHFSKKNLKRVMKDKGGQEFGVSNIAELEALGDTLDDFDIKAFKTAHKVFGISFRHYSYLITWHGKTIYLSGDTTIPTTIGEIKNIDLAFIPYWLYENAKTQNITIDAKEIGIYHLYPSEIEPAIKLFKDKDRKSPLTENGQIIRLDLQPN
jgi:L-ascorbate metabolism protein UlaG (beta-lactamase superfamily)